MDNITLKELGRYPVGVVMSFTALGLDGELLLCVLQGTQGKSNERGDISLDDVIDLVGELRQDQYFANKFVSNNFENSNGWEG